MLLQKIKEGIRKEMKVNTFFYVRYFVITFYDLSGNRLRWFFPQSLFRVPMLWRMQRAMVTSQTIVSFLRVGGGG